IRPYLRETLAADRGKNKLQICFALPSFNEALAQVERELGTKVDPGFTTAPTFAEKNGSCFFGFYSAVVRGNGDMYPCCMLLNPTYKPLGNAMQGSFAEKWEGESYNQLRHEMREVMLAGGDAEYQPGKFQTLAPECVNAHACGLKNMYMRSDEAFYRDLGEALETARAKEIRWTGNRQQLARALQRAKARHPKLRKVYEKAAAASPRFRTFMKRYFAVR
ncbi:MAG TPA: SPASM domain-containing protein, partial [Thermoanaerobaculia bacterium]